MRAASALAVVAVALLSGCAKRDSITVGAVPDDYRTNHPIFIAEKEEVLDLPVAASDHGITDPQRVALRGFLANYDRSAHRRLGSLSRLARQTTLAASKAAKGFARVGDGQWRAEIEDSDHVLSGVSGGDVGAHPRRIHGDAGPDGKMRTVAGGHPQGQRGEQALREFRLLIPKQSCRPDRQPGGFSRSAQT